MSTTPNVLAYDAWSYYEPYKITGAGTDTVLDITLSIDSDNIESDAKDLRAALSDGTKLSVSINSISGTDTLSIRCYVTFTTSPEDNSYIFFYYGNSNPNDQTDFSLLDRIRKGEMSDSLFIAYTGGVNEFDLIYAGGKYVMVTNGGKISTANSPALLVSETPLQVIPGTWAFPSIKFLSDGKYHLWLVDSEAIHAPQYAIAHFISDTTDPKGSYTYHDYVICGEEYHYTDHNMMVGPDGNLYCACWLNDNWGWGETTNPAHLLRCSVADGTGTWTDLGDIFSVVGRSGWHKALTAYEHNCQLAVLNSRMYFLFDGLDTITTTLPIRSAIVEISTDTGKAITAPSVLFDGVNDERICGNPVFLDDGINGARIYFTDYEDYPDEIDNLRYLSLSTYPAQDRLPDDLARINFGSIPADVGIGKVIPNVWGSSTVDATGLHTATGNGGMRSWTANAATLGDFTVEFEFTGTTIAAGTGYVLMIFNGGPVFNFEQPHLQILIYNNKIYWRISDYTHTNAQKAGTKAITATNKYLVRITRKGSAVKGYVNGTLDFNLTYGYSLNNMGSWGIGNQYNYYAVASQTFIGTISKFCATSKYIPVISGTQEDPVAIIDNDNVRGLKINGIGIGVGFKSSIRKR